MQTIAEVRIQMGDNDNRNRVCDRLKAAVLIEGEEAINGFACVVIRTNSVMDLMNRMKEDGFEI